MVNLTSVIHDLITANHILHYHSVVDAYGHISVRHPDDPSIFILSANRAPAIVSKPSDFVQYYVANASAVDSDAPKGYIERYIHSEMYKRFSNVSCVIHAHAEDVLAYANSGVPLKPTFHMPAFLGEGVPVWDIENAYQQGDVHDILVRSEHLGANLALQFSNPQNRSIEAATPDRKVVLMRKHGFTAQGPDIRSAVFYAVFTTAAARVQTSAALLRNAFGSLESNAWAVDGQAFTNDFEPLTAQQAADTEQSIGGTIDRPWGLWVAEVESQPLYVNNG